MSFTCINLFNLHNIPMKQVLLLPHFTDGEIKLQRLSNMLKVTQKFREGANVQTSAVSLLRVHALDHYAKLHLVGKKKSKQIETVVLMLSNAYYHKYSL